MSAPLITLPGRPYAEAIIRQEAPRIGRLLMERIGERVKQEHNYSIWELPRSLLSVAELALLETIEEWEQADG